MFYKNKFNSNLMKKEKEKSVGYNVIPHVHWAYDNFCHFGVLSVHTYRLTQKLC